MSGAEGETSCCSHYLWFGLLAYLLWPYLVSLLQWVKISIWEPLTSPAPTLVVEPKSDGEKLDVLPESLPRLDPRNASPRDPSDPNAIVCWDPSTMQVLGKMKAMNAEQVADSIARARKAQQIWVKSSFQTRRKLLRVLQAFIMENAEVIARVACRDSGKTVVDAMLGEVMTTCEKIKWTLAHGEDVLAPEYRESGTLNMHKTSRLEFVPVGVVGAIVPWNYPFHNVFNPLISALFAGNALVVKVSEYASWSTQYYGRAIQECLKTVGAPLDLVQFVTGYGESGNALVTGGVDKVIFVGSVGVGKAVMKACVDKLTPVVLELGGKDPFIICDDANPSALAQLACRGVFQHMGQNCAGPER